MSIRKRYHAFLFLILSLLFFVSVTPSIAAPDRQDSYIAIPGLIDLRTTFSDGAHSIEELVLMARSRGFRILFINDHDRIAIAYGLPPFRNIFRYKKEFPSILTHGAKKFLQEIDRLSGMYPDMIIIPGSKTSAYYYWTGSYFKGDLTANDYDRRIIILNFNDPDDYNHIPNLHNKLSLKYTKRLLPLSLIFIGCLIIGFLLMTAKGIFRIIGLFIIIASGLAIIDYNPFRSSIYTQYDGDQGIAPYQELIEYVNERGGFTFWNYPEQKSGVREYGPISVNTPPYPRVLHESMDYTGFAAIYGAFTTVTQPGGEWDRILNEYCQGERDRAPWGISTADFHEDGRLNQKLGAFPTTFLVKDFSKEAVLEAMEKGRMYCSRGDSKTWPKLDYFTISGGDGEAAFMGETLITAQYPVIRFRISYRIEKPGSITVSLIRGGEVVKEMKEISPIEVKFIDRDIPEGKKTYYRIIDSNEHLISNPVFVKYDPSTGTTMK